MEKEDVMANVSCMAELVEDGSVDVFDKNARICDPHLFAKEFDKRRLQHMRCGMVFASINSFLDSASVNINSKTSSTIHCSSKGLSATHSTKSSSEKEFA